MDEQSQAVLMGRSDGTTTPPSPVPVPAPTTVPVPVDAPISTTPPTPASPAAPVAGQATAATPEAATTPTPPAPVKGQAEVAVSDEQLLASVGMDEAPDKKLGRVEREYAASSKESRRLSEYVKRLRDTLDKQGLVVTEDDQKLPTGLFATKKYNKDVGELALKFKDLPEASQVLFESEPQKAIDMIVDKAKKALVRVTPTTDQLPVAAISPERHETALAYLNDAKWETGDVRFPGMTANRKLIEQMVNSPTTPKGLKDFYNQEPEMALSLLHLQLEHARSHIRKQVTKAAEAAEAKTKAADAGPTLAPSGGGVPSLEQPGGGSYADQLAAKIGQTRLNQY